MLKTCSNLLSMLLFTYCTLTLAFRLMHACVQNAICNKPGFIVCTIGVPVYLESLNLAHHSGDSRFKFENVWY